MRSLFVKEVVAFFSSLIAYVVLGVYLLLTGLLVWVLPDTNVMDYGYADLYNFFSLSPYLFLLLAPAITMRQLAEEKRTGTLELLLSRPMGLGQLLAGKFFASWLILALALVPTVLYVVTLSALGSPPGNFDLGATVGSYVGLLALGGVFISIGLFSSAVNQNQIVSFLVAALLCFTLYEGLASLSGLDMPARLSLWLQQLSLNTHYASVSRGLIDLGDLAFFAAVAVVFLQLARLVVKAKTW